MVKVPMSMVMGRNISETLLMDRSKVLEKLNIRMEGPLKVNGEMTR